MEAMEASNLPQQFSVMGKGGAYSLLIEYDTVSSSREDERMNRTNMIDVVTTLLVA